MKQLALAWALMGALALAPLVPAQATIETPEAKEAAARAADAAWDDMRELFEKSALKPGQYLWKKGREGSQVTQVVVSLSDQMAYAYSDGELVGVSTISSGTNTNPTPTGIFPILEKKRLHRSIKYDNAPMPWMQRLDEYGIALHAGHLPGHPASHGCVRLPHEFASKLFASTRVGTEVLIGA